MKSKSGFKNSKLFAFLVRFGLFLSAMAIGVSVFLLLTWAGKKNKGPLDDLLMNADFRISQLEKNVLGKDERKTRSASLQWLYKYRTNKTMFNTLDTLLLGAYDDNTAESYESIIKLEDSIQTKLSIISIYTAWGSKKIQVFPQLRVQAISDLGSIPMVTWEPWLNDFNEEEFPFLKNKKDKNYEGMKEITAGKFDSYIDKWANAAKQFGTPLLLRFGHEMNDPFRYPWGPQNNKPEDFIAAWHHVVDRFKAIGANNVIWIWSPHPAYITYPQFYPGHDYVDWIGVTALNYGTVATWSQWWTFKEIFGKFYDSVSLYKKPMMITEFGSLPVGGDRAVWFKQALDSIPVKYPALKGIVFYHATSDNTTTYKSLDWSFENDKPAAEAVKKSIHNWEKIKKGE
jgi:beta-mannanase